MPVSPEYFIPEMPPPYQAFLNSLWDQLGEDLRGTFSNIRPGAPTDNPLPPTKLERWRERLELFASMEAIATVAKKAYQTEAGRKAIEDLTRAALAIPEIVAKFPADLEMMQRNYLARLLAAIQALRDMVEEDRPILTTSEPLPPGYWYTNALGDVLGEKIILGRLFDLERPESITGRVYPCGLSKLLTSLEKPLVAKIETLLPFAETTERGEVEVRRFAFALWDALDDHAEAFEQGATRPLKRNALVAAFVTALLNRFPSHDECLIRVQEMIKRREKTYAKHMAE